MLINPIFERNFHESSHGFRRNRSCHTAIKEVLQHYKDGYKVVVDADIKGFFDNIPHKLIMALVEREISDGNILNIVKKFLRTGVMEEGQVRQTRKGYKFVRYADDFVVLSKSNSKAKESLEVVIKCVEDDLGLELHKEKTVTQIVKEVKKAQPTISLHLKLLLLNDVIESRKHGKFISYQIKDKRIKKIIELMK